MVVYEAWIPILKEGVSEYTCVYWRERTKESFNKIIDGFNRMFLNEIDPYTGEPKSKEELVKQYMVKPANINYKQVVNEEYKEGVPICKHLVKGINAIPDYLSKIEALKDKEDWYKQRVDEGYTKYSANRVYISGLCGDRRRGFNCVTILTGILTKNTYVKRYIRDIDRFEPQFWCINIFGFKYLNWKMRFMNTLQILTSLYVRYFEYEEYRNEVKRVLRDYIENEVKPNVIPKYTLDTLEIIDSPYSTYGEYHVKVIAS